MAHGPTKPLGAVMQERAEHVWVSYTGRWDEDRAPGLLLGWRQREGRGWEGWVISAEQAPPGKTEGMVRQGWVPASAIRPVQT